ncbi:hypothetical protein C3L23_02185 [Nautilia sp. PV-1]|uniref:hypothetical protein n=1 Tax=Nautilia sp. PV-1 TaxID=2579250 RepID=UPI000FD9D610|nr:hypothetical protein [Nautilia sp. PV-1]AZV46121.1 hypothetical protein C3L23_02185 [Nautilia sp. PV-1]
MKKMIFITFIVISLFANTKFVPQNGIYINTKTADKYYNLENAYIQTETLIHLIRKMLNNQKFIRLSNLMETAKVQANTSLLLEKLLNFLEGEKAYSNTEFDNSGNIAGIKGILKDYIDSQLFNLPQKAKNNILNSINSSDFISIAKKTEQLLNNINKNNVKEIINNFNLLFNTYVNNINHLNVPLLKNFNPKTEQKLIKDYRIEAKTSIIKTLKIFKKYLNKNKEVYNQQ